MKSNLVNFNLIFLVIIWTSSFAIADDCLIVSQLNESMATYCCKTDGIIERICSIDTKDTCDFRGSPGTIHHCENETIATHDLYKDLPKLVDTLTAATHVGLAGHAASCERVESLSPPIPSDISDVSFVPSYSVNLMWINQRLVPDRPYLFPAKDEASLREKYLNNLFKWAEATHGNTVNLWYDSSTTSPDALAKTLALIEEAEAGHSDWAKIHLRDIRTIPEVAGNPVAFNTKVPIYFRVDLLRAMAANHLLSTGETSNFVYADLDMAPNSGAELFDSETVKHLKEYGFVMAEDPAGISKVGFENGFQIISNSHPNILESIHRMLIRPNLDRALTMGSRDKPVSSKNVEQAVYLSYREAFLLLYHLDGYGVLKEEIDPGTETPIIRPFDKDKYDYESYLQVRGLGRILFLESSQEKLHWLDEDGVRKMRHPWVPTKSVTLPPSHFSK